MRKVLARVRGESEAGFTLVEMLTVMVLGSVIGVAVTSAMVSGLKSQTRVNAHQTSLEQTRVAMQRVTREIRNIAPYKSLLLAQDND
ncbi:MAG TPA: prepilin-type N-terminal cleavage/methylation domain-containing protein, partial [Mycobacteriales bacterium]|nr:prepilin-type N-terminal cleavage/methylation domain-containing protein [Mycobacteriales bacterium]